MTLSPNQFAQTTEVGYLDLQTGRGNVITAVHLSGQTTPLVPGQTVKLVDNSTPIPSVQAAAITDIPYGVVVRNLRRSSIPAEMALEVALNGTYMYMQASAAIARGASVSYNPATGTVATAANPNAIVGQAFDKALASGDMIRVVINPAAAPA